MFGTYVVVVEVLSCSFFTIRSREHTVLMLPPLTTLPSLVVQCGGEHTVLLLLPLTTWPCSVVQCGGERVFTNTFCS